MRKASENGKSKSLKRQESMISSVNNKNNSPNKDKEKENIPTNLNDSDCESIISEREGMNKEKKAMMDMIIRSKMGGKSILEIAKDLNISIQVN